MSLTESQRELIEEVVEQTLVKTLLKFGVDASSPDKIIALQDDLRYLREWRKSMIAVRRAGMVAAVGAIVTGVLAAVLIGFRQMLFRGG